MINKILPYLGFAAILILFCLVYYPKELFMYPSLIHAWAQADRMAIAVCFYDNGMNFLKPATLAQFSKEGVVGVEFPIQAYITAGIAKFFGREYISLIFRLLDMVICCVGLFFLFQATYKRTRDFICSIVPPLFIFCSPVFIFYACNYLPDATAASIVFIGFYFLLDYFDNKKKKDFVYAIFFLTLAALIKTSTLSYLAGFMLIIFLQEITQKDRTLTRQRIILVATAALAIIAILYNYFNIKWLNAKYDAWLFMNKPIPFQSWRDFNDYLDFGFKHKWMNDYFVLPQYMLFISLICTAIYLIYKNKDYRSKLHLLIIYFLFSLIFFYLLGNNLIPHDYYVIAIFFPLIAFALFLSVTAVKQEITSERGTTALRIALVSATVIMFFFADFYHYQRMRPDNPLHINSYRTFWMKDADRIATEAGMGRKEKIVVIDEYAPNLALIYFDRKGLVLGRDRWNGDLEIVKAEMKKLETPWMSIAEEGKTEWLKTDSSFFKDFDEIITKDSLVLFKLKKY